MADIARSPARRTISTVTVLVGVCVLAALLLGVAGLGGLGWWDHRSNERLTSALADALPAGWSVTSTANGGDGYNSIRYAEQSVEASVLPQAAATELAAKLTASGFPRVTVRDPKEVASDPYHPSRHFPVWSVTASRDGVDVTADIAGQALQTDDSDAWPSTGGSAVVLRAEE
jgi:hypothetical protein